MKWDTVIRPPLEERTKKPRRRGITMVMDKGMGIRSLEDLIEVSGEYIDIIKITAGTYLLYKKDVLYRKIKLISENNIDVMLGGHLNEIAIIKMYTMNFYICEKAWGWPY